MTNKGKKYAPKLTLAPMEFEEAVKAILGPTISVTQKTVSKFSRFKKARKKKSRLSAD